MKIIFLHYTLPLWIYPEGVGLKHINYTHINMDTSALVHVYVL